MTISLTPSSTMRSIPLREDHIASVLLVRRARDAVLGKGLFSEPAWDILLELFAAKLGGRNMSLKELAVAIDAPSSTAARWLGALKDRGLIEQEIDPARPADHSICLTAEAETRMEHLTSRWASAFSSIS